MIKLTNLAAQTIQPGQSVIFNTIMKKGGCAECFRLGTSSIKLCKRPASYEAVFQANVTTETAGIAQLSFELSGDILPESTMVRQIATANDFDSISLSDLISVNCCDFDRLTVTNTGTIPVVISTNPLFYVKRVS